MKIESDGDGLFTLQLAKHELQTIAAACHTKAQDWKDSPDMASRGASTLLAFIVHNIVRAVLTTTGKTNEALNIS